MINKIMKNRLEQDEYGLYINADNYKWARSVMKTSFDRVEKRKRFKWFRNLFNG